SSLLGGSLLASENKNSFQFSVAGGAMGAPTAVQHNDSANGRGLPPSMVERMTLILDSFDGRRDRLTLEDVARRTELPRSTTHRIVDQLVRLRWLPRTAAGYALG